MNVGDLETFTLTGAPSDGGGFTYCWFWWDGTVTVTSVPSATKQLNLGGTMSITLIQCDAYGHSQTYTISITVNNPPLLINAPTISTNDAVFPFSTVLSSVAYDPDHPGGVELNFSWLNGSVPLGSGVTSVPSTGTYQNSLSVAGVTQNTTYTQVIYDNAAGTTKVNYSVRGTAPTGLQGSGASVNNSIISNTSNLGEVIIGPNQAVTFSAFAQDTHTGQLQFAWTLKQFDGWSSDFSVTDTPAPLTTGAYQDQITRNVGGETPGLKIANCLVTSLSTGQSINIRETVQLLSALPPTIISITTDAPTISAGLAVSQAGWVHFFATASDPNNAIVSYRWDFTQPSITIYGKTVLLTPAQYSVFAESSLETGGPRAILGSLTVTDRFGQSTTVQLSDFLAIQVFPSTQVAASTSGTGTGGGSSSSGSGSGGSSSGGSSSGGSGGSTGTMKKVYWGVNANLSLSDGDIVALNSQFQTNRILNVTLTPSGQYLYFVIPASFGSATFNVNGLLNTAWILTTQTFDGDTYNIYRSQNLLTGTFQVAVS
jgi:hypothetical protein